MNNLGIYIHIPFCVKKCAYCDFLSAPASREVMEKYANQLVREIECKSQSVSDYIVNSIFVGGGTPSFLDESLTDIIFSAVNHSFHLAEKTEWSVECNPGTVSFEKLCSYKKLGVNRISFGLQSTIQKELQMLGRIHTYPEFVEGYREARKAGFDNINVDLMSAIPLQTKESWENSLETVAKLEPEHISAYSLIIEPGTPFYEKYADTPPVDEDEDVEMYEDTGNILREYGYERYEISNYAKSGYECKHNLKYWERKPYLGLGLGASSQMKHKRWKNVSSIDKYLETTDSMNERVEEVELTKKVEMEEFIFLGLRKMKGISISEFQRTFGTSIFSLYGHSIEKMTRGGLLFLNGDTLCLSLRGIEVSNLVLSEFVE